MGGKEWIFSAFRMGLNLSDHQLNIDYYMHVIYTLTDNHKLKTINRYAKNKEKGIQGYHYRKPAKWEKTAREEKGTEELPKQR